MKFLKNKGYTLVEVVIAIGMIAGLLVLVMKMSSLIRGDVAKGTVDLQNLQDARVVINSLRRDFLCATPIYDDEDSENIRNEVRADPILFASSFNKPQKSRPIVINEHQINFCKLTNDSAGNQLKEEIYYFFDPVSKTLNRRGADGEKLFKGVENIKFDVYYHPLREDVPMLLVSMIIKTKESNETKELPLNTTICSSIVNKDLTNLDWNNLSD